MTEQKVSEGFAAVMAAFATAAGFMRSKKQVKSMTTRQYLKRKKKRKMQKVARRITRSAL